MRKFKDSVNITGKYIENIRVERNMSREELARRLQLLGINVDRTFIFKIEKNNQYIKDFELIAICKILDINMENFKKELNN